MTRTMVAMLAAAFLGAGCGAEADKGDKKETASSSAPAAAAPAASSGGSAGGAHPLQQWMKSNAATALNSGSTDKLVGIFRRSAELAPPDAEFATWAEIANAGAAASERRDLEGARAACKQCHEAHRTGYRARFRDRALPPSR